MAGPKSRTVGIQCSRKLIHDTRTDIEFETKAPDVNSTAESLHILQVQDSKEYQSNLSIAWVCCMLML